MTRSARPVLAVLLAGVMALAGGSAASAAPGDLDAGFGTGGVFTAPFLTTFPGAEDSQTTAVDSQGRVYLSATQEPVVNGGPLRHVNVVRLTSAGVPDASFGTGGTAVLPTSGDIRNAGIVVDALDRPIILTNNGENTAAWKIGLTRLTTAGIPDVSFDTDGVAESGLPGSSASFYGTLPAGIALDKDGGILVTGTFLYCTPGCAKPGGFVARFTAAGALDATFGTGGWTGVGGTSTEMAAIKALPGGGAVAAGYDYATWIVARLTAGGGLDPTFNGTGQATSSLGKASLDLVSSYGVDVDPQNRPLVVGQFTPQSGSAGFAVARWTAAGAPDASFGTGTPAPGTVLVPGVSGRANDVAAGCADGTVLVAGSAGRPSGMTNRMTLVRLTTAGALDPAFGAGGVASMTAGDNNTTQDLVATTAGAYVAGFRRLNDGMTVTDYPTLARFEACGAATVTPPVVTPPVETPVTIGGTPTPKPTPALKVSDVVAFPSAKACVSRRLFQIRLRVPASANVVSADVRVNGKSAGVRKGKRLRSTVDLRNLPKGRFSVQIVLRLKSGKTLKATRRYRTCVPKRRAR